MPTTQILDSYLAHTESGHGRTVVFLHGNPTSSHLWRNVIPHVADRARCIAPDLIGMGASGKPDIGYRFADHADYLDAWFDRLGLDDVVLAGHDWGGSLGMDWAARHPERVRGIALVETFLRPMTWAEYPPRSVDFFRTLRTPEAGERMALDDNWFIETGLRATGPGIADADIDVYRAPYPDRATRRPLLQWPREIPLDGTPADVAARFTAYDNWLATSVNTPKLLLTTEPGNLIAPAMVDWARANIAALSVVPVGPAGHHAPEDQPDAIGRAIADWLSKLEER
ncbi:MAG TPA: haloalkane dehalogenase [Pseudonocardiaceae bacterium]|nr:haloalkane dehalogenase [Pseudonocardiaceae bacterium]